jgi:hypothetical protein
MNERDLQRFSRREVHWPHKRETARRIYWTFTFATNAENVRLLFTGDGIVHHLDAGGVVLVASPVRASVLLDCGFGRADKDGVIHVTTCKNVAFVVSLLRAE